MVERGISTAKKMKSSKKRSALVAKKADISMSDISVVARIFGKSMAKKLIMDTMSREDLANAYLSNVLG